MTKYRKLLLDHALSMDNVCNHRLFSIPFKVKMAEEQEYLWEKLCNDDVNRSLIDHRQEPIKMRE